MALYEKRGYLDSSFKLFHLTDTALKELDYHYHDFDKIIIFIKGKVTYTIEGRSYELRPYDIVLVNHNDIHKPTVDNSVPYERIIVYISPNFINTYQTANYNLNFCFEQAKIEHSNVLRVHTDAKHSLLKSAKELELAFSDTAYANELRLQLLFLEFMVQLNRTARSHHLEYLSAPFSNEKIVQIMSYINEHLTQELTIDTLSAHFFISKYHMMRLFKAETGCTIGSYISHKRLLVAKDAIANLVPVTQACFDCGYRDYSAFSRAYKSVFGESPKHSMSDTLTLS